MADRFPLPGGCHVYRMVEKPSEFTVWHPVSKRAKTVVLDPQGPDFLGRILEQCAELAGVSLEAWEKEASRG